ncbi:MAG: endopeptidase La, partial [bacterium]|nr:endopeptidase La [bacterium]
MSDPLTLPVLPLRDLVLFPGVTLPIAVGRRQTLKTIEAAQAAGEPVVLAVAQREDVDEVTPEGLHTVGTIARIEQVHRTLSGVQILLYGLRRGTAVRYRSTEGGVLQAVVRETEVMPPVNPDDPAFLALYREARRRADELGEKTGHAKEIVRQVLAGIDDPSDLADLVAGYIDIPNPERQSVLETLSVEERLRRVLIHVQRQINVLEAQEDLQSKVQEELGGRQREVYLREQLKTIRHELGDDSDDEDFSELREKIKALALPPEARKEVDRELRRLSRTNREAMEAQVIRTYLETVVELPWSERSDERLDQQQASKILEEDHYGLKDVKDRVLEFLAVRQLRLAAAEREAAEREAAEQLAADEAAAGTEEAESAEQAIDDQGRTSSEAPPSSERHEEDVARAPILLFLGPPGVGKTSLAKS